MSPSARLQRPGDTSAAAGCYRQTRGDQRCWASDPSAAPRRRTPCPPSSARAHRKRAPHRRSIYRSNDKENYGLSRAATSGRLASATTRPVGRQRRDTDDGGAPVRPAGTPPKTLIGSTHADRRRIRCAARRSTMPVGLVLAVARRVRGASSRCTRTHRHPSLAGNTPPLPTCHGRLRQRTRQASPRASRPSNRPTDSTR